MEGEALRLAAVLWRDFFPKEIFSPRNNKIVATSLFMNIFQFDEDVERLSENYNYLISSNPFFEISIPKLSRLLNADFQQMLKTNPSEVIGCIGLSLSITVSLRYSTLSRPFKITPRLVSLLPRTLFAELRSSTVGQLVSIKGYVLKVSSCKPLVVQANFLCSLCMQPTVTQLEDGIMNPPVKCEASNGCRGKYFELQRSSVVASDYQRIKLQEMDSLEEDTARVPRTFEVELRGGLVDCCIAGEVLDIVGIVKTCQSSRAYSKNTETALYQLYILANSAKRSRASKGDGDEEFVGRQRKRQRQHCDEQLSGNKADEIDKSISCDDRDAETEEVFTERDLIKIRAIAMTEGCLGLLCASLCPDIFGHELVKCGLLLGLFGGSSHEDAVDERNATLNKIGCNIRNDIHVLVVGDPGLGKSQMLRAAAALAPRAVFVCGNTTTTAGLTVAVSREGGRGDMTIEAGALVLADRGVCCIDELDKMTSDPHSLLEAMEQQQISIAKSGVVTSLRSKCSVLAAANPMGGHYDRRKSVCENLKIASALLSRFDLVFILLDKPDVDHDKMISEHIMKTHAIARGQKGLSGGGSNDKPSSDTGGQSENLNGTLTLYQRLRRETKNFQTRYLSPDVFRKYITYAKRYVHPVLTPGAAKILQKLYLTMRAQASLGDSIPVTTRHLESLIRLSQARARVELRQEVTEQDANDVAHLLQESLLDAFTNETGFIFCMINQCQILTSCYLPLLV